MNEPSPSAPHGAAAMQADVDFRLLQIAYERLPLSLLLTVVVTVVFIGLMALVFPHDISAFWACAILTSVVARYALWRAYRRSPPQPAAIGRWRSRYLVGSAATGAAWTSGPVLIAAHGAGEAASLLAGTLLSVCAVAMNTQSAQRGAMQAFIVAALAPFALALVHSGGKVELLLALVLLAGMASLIVVGRASSRGLHELIEAQITLAATADEAGTARAQAESASKAKTRFLANMSHELRSPLNAVIGAAQLLRAERHDAERQAHLIDGIHRSGANLLGLIENILDLSRIEAGQVDLRPVDFHLVECIDSALASAGLAAQAKGLRLACIVSTELPAWRHGDADRLRQVVMNLLGNAVKFTDRGEVTVRVEPGAAPESVRISVSDTGVGIAAAELAHIFEPFRQADEGADRRYGGSGLGLAIVRQHVVAMGGHIGVSSRLGEGSRFETELPLPRAAAVGAVPEALRHDVLFVEPHEPSAQALQAHLLRLGCTVQRCDGAAEVREALAGMGGLAGTKRPWLLLSAEAPEHEAVLDAVVDWIEPEHVIVMADRTTYDAERGRDAMHMPRQLSRPVTRAALVSRMTAEHVTEPGSLQLPQGLLTAQELEVMTHVLVVEDDELNRTIVCRLLQHGGCRVSAAGGGEQALQALRQPDRVDLVLMDWQMPDMDGLEVTRRLRAGEAGDAGLSVPIVALTANAFSEDREACLRAGMNDFLTKPVQARSLMAAIERWTRGTAVSPAAPAMATPGQTGVPVFDPSVLAALPMVADGSAPEYAQELLEMFMDGGAQAVADLERATAARDTEALLRLLHTLKSTSASVGALEIAELASVHEARLRQGGEPSVTLPRQLHESLRRLRQAVGEPAHAAAGALN